MGRLSKIVAEVALASLAIGVLSGANGWAQGAAPLSSLTVSAGDSSIHIFPSRSVARTLSPLATDTGPLVYHTGGAIMPKANTYAIFWLPPTLQDGTPTSVSLKYRPIIRRFLTDYPAHGIDNNNTQYFQQIGGITTYIHNVGTFAGAFLDTSPYPASGCSDAATPSGCLTDAQIRREIKRVIALRLWPVGMTSMFLIFTSQGEGSCFDAFSGICAYTVYCAYHGHIGTGSTAIIYGNEPYAETSFCQANTAPPSPNGDPAADDAATIASHELTEAITDPLLNAWYTEPQGNEIGDLCAYTYGTLGWDGGQANEMWNGNFYLLQQEFDNFANGCVDVGP